MTPAMWGYVSFAHHDTLIIASVRLVSSCMTPAPPQQRMLALTRAIGGCFYHRAGSQRARLQWTPDLHGLFLRAVAHLGGPDKVSPKGIVGEWSQLSKTL